MTRVSRPDCLFVSLFFKKKKKKDLAVGYDPGELLILRVSKLDSSSFFLFSIAHITFQHDAITGISHAALFLDWVNENPSSRGVLCHRVVCEILRPTIGAAAMERGKMSKFFWAKSIRFNRGLVFAFFVFLFFCFFIFLFFIFFVFYFFVFYFFCVK